MPVIGDREHLSRSVYQKIANQLGLKWARPSAIDHDTELVLVWNPWIYGAGAKLRKKIERLSRRHKNTHFINATHFNDDKRVVQKEFEKCFGYDLSVDPIRHEGPLVEKSRKNGTHNGRVKEGPLVAINPKFVYQRVVDNSIADALVEDLRVPIINYEPLFSYLKYRPLSTRFKNRNTYAQLAGLRDVFSEAELQTIARYTKEIGLEIGELDILRDCQSQRIYVVDANNTPHGPPNGIHERDGNIAVSWLSSAFANAYLSGAQRRPGRSKWPWTLFR